MIYILPTCTSLDFNSETENCMGRILSDPMLKLISNHSAGIFSFATAHVVTAFTILAMFFLELTLLSGSGSPEGWENLARRRGVA